MAATSLKLPDDLKRRITALAASEQKTPHAFMIEVLKREADRAELRQRFANDAADAEAEALSSRKSIPAAEAFAYLERRAVGKKSKLPRPRRWRGSK